MESLDPTKLIFDVPTRVISNITEIITNFVIGAAYAASSSWESLGENYAKTLILILGEVPAAVVAGPTPEEI